MVQEEPNSAFEPRGAGYAGFHRHREGQALRSRRSGCRRSCAEAAVVGTAAQRSIIWRNRDENVVIWPGSKSWELGFAGGSHAFDQDGVRLINERTRFHYYATGITPVMVKPPVGAGSQYVIGLRDANGRDPRRHQHLQAARAAQGAGQAVLGDHGLRQPDPLHAADGPASARGHQPGRGVVAERRRVLRRLLRPGEAAEAQNWVQTIPGKGWNMLWRIYGPTQVWYDKKWRPGEIELVG